MEPSVMSPVLNQMGLDEALSYLHSLGVDSLENAAAAIPARFT